MREKGWHSCYNSNSSQCEWLPAGSPEPRSNISANIRAMKKLGTALERARQAAFKSVEGSSQRLILA
jgi:hypothetical protein